MKHNVPIKILTDEEVEIQQKAAKIVKLKRQIKHIWDESERHMLLLWRTCLFILLMLFITLVYIYFTSPREINISKASAHEVSQPVKNEHEINWCKETWKNFCVKGKSIPNLVQKKNVWDVRINRRVNYAYHIWWLDFLLLLANEGGTFSAHTKSRSSYMRCHGKLINGTCKWYWKKHWDWGACQISDYYYKHITDDPRFWQAYWQLDKCLELYKGGTKFYWFKHRKRTRHLFSINKSEHGK